MGLPVPEEVPSREACPTPELFSCHPVLTSTATISDVPLQPQEAPAR